MKRGTLHVFGWVMMLASQAKSAPTESSAYEAAMGPYTDRMVEHTYALMLCSKYEDREDIYDLEDLLDGAPLTPQAKADLERLRAAYNRGVADAARLNLGEAECSKTVGESRTRLHEAEAVVERLEEGAAGL